MNAAYLSALAALAGSAIGGLTSFLSSWVSQNAQLKARLFIRERMRRQKLYRDFVEEGSTLYIDALTHDTADLTKMIPLYALISRMRILSSPPIIEEAEKVARKIVATYPEPNKTLKDLRHTTNDHASDPLRAFSEACRAELRGDWGVK